MKKKDEKVINIEKNKHKYRNATIRKIEEKLKGASILIYSGVYAVALKYEQGVIKTPRLVYKSKNIKDSKLAAFNISLPVFKNNIASDIAAILKIGNPIIPEMYVSVAILLAEIYNNTYDEILDFENLLDDTLFYTHFKSKLKVEVGKNLQEMIKNTKFAEEIEKVKKDIISEFGLILPPIKVKTNLDLSPNKYLIKIGNTTMCEGEVYADKNVLSSVQTVIAVHLTKCIKDNLGELLTRHSIYQLLEKLKIHNSEEYVNNILDQISIGKIQAVLTNLLKENIPIKELEKILESISIIRSKDKDDDVDSLTDKARQAISMTICERNLGDNGKLNVITLSPDIEKTITESASPDYKSITLDPKFSKALFDSIETKLEQVASDTENVPIILCASPIRLLFRRLIERTYPQITVLSYNDIHKNYKCNAVVQIKIKPL